MGFLAELCSFLWTRKRFWLIPITLVVVAVGGLLMMARETAGVSSGIRVKEPLVPMTSGHYRHDAAFLTR
jgi:hypothetical protein